MTATHLAMQDVTRALPGFTLGPISLTVEPGLVYAVVGPNGSGKSTLFRILMGLIRPDSGQVSRFDTPLHVDNAAQQQRIAFVPEQLTGHDTWTFAQLTNLYQRSYPRFDSSALASIQQTIDTGKAFSSLSKGIQRRAMLALALAADADLLMCDEPTDGLDPFARQDLLTSFSQHMEQGDRSIMLASHNLDDVRRIADMVILLQNGRHIGTWPKDAMLEGWQRLLLSTAPGLPLDGEVTRTTGAGVQIVSSDAVATRAHAATLGITILQHQSVDMVETLRILLDENGSDSVNRQIPVTIHRNP